MSPPPPLFASLSRISLLALLAVAGSMATALPVCADVPPASTSIWGYSGLVIMPTATVHGFRDFSVGCHLLTRGSTLNPLPYVTAGVFEGLECGVLYGVPLDGFSGLSGHAKYQLIRPTREQPRAVAIGLNLIGVNGTNRYVTGNDLYLVLSQDVNTALQGKTYTLFSGHFGFAGSLQLGSRMMAGVEVPFGEKLGVVGDYMGPLGTLSGFFNVGLTFRPIREWQFRAYTMGAPGEALFDRDYGIGIGYTGNMVGNAAGVGERPTPAPTPKPPTPSPVAVATVPPTPAETPTPALISPSSALSPDGLPSPGSDEPASLRGTLMDDKGRPLPGWTVAVGGPDRAIVTDLKGRYAMQVPQGPYDLTVRNPQGVLMLTKSIRLVTPKGMDLPLVVALPVGEIKGMVIDRQSKQGLSAATLQLFRAGEIYNLSNRDNGAFYMGDLPAGDYRVVVTRSRYTPYEGTIRISNRQETALVVPLSPKPGSLAGRVTTLKGVGQPGVSVTVPGLNLTVTTDRLGAYQFPEMPPGSHEVLYMQGLRRLATTLVRVRSDETTTENVTMSAQEPATNKGGTISGLVLDATTRRAVAGVKLVVEGGDLTVLTITGSDGHFSVADLPAGRYRITASHTGFQTRETTASVTAKAGAIANITLTPAR